MRQPAAVKYAEMLGFQDSALPALITNTPVDNNRPGILTFTLNPFVFSNYLNNPEVHENTRTVLRKLVEGLDEESVSQMNPVLELLYVK